MAAGTAVSVNRLSAAEAGVDQGVVRGGCVAASAGVVGDRRELPRMEGVYLRRTAKQRLADQQVVDELAVTVIDPRVPLPLGEAGGEVPQPGGIALVGAIGAGRAELGAGRAEQDLGGRGLWLVVEVTDHHHLPRRPLPGEQLV